MLLGALPLRLWLLLSLFLVACVGFPYANWNVPEHSDDHYQLAILGPRTQRYQEFAQYMVMAAQSSRVVGFVRDDLQHPACDALSPEAVAVVRGSHGVLFWIDTVDVPAGADGIAAYVKSLSACVGISNSSLLMYALAPNFTSHSTFHVPLVLRATG
jgi:hypothetical protein